MDKVLTRHLKVYCPQHQAIFEIAESPKIVCEIKDHALSNNFPREEFWEYCCDCQTFSPSRLAAGGKAETSCPRCERPTLSRFLCNVCNVLTFDSGENTRDKRFYLSLEAFAIVPSCPGCLTDFTAKKLHLHKCAEIRAVLETGRETCPFCKKDIVKNIEPNKILPEPPMPAPLKIQQKSNEQNLTDIRTEQKNFRKEINDLKETVMLLNDKIEKQHKFIQSLVKPQPQPQSQQKTQSQSTAEQPQIIKREPQFPVSVENYLRKVRFLPEKASADVVGGLLVQNSKNDAEFLIIKDSALADGLFYALPSVTKFVMKSEYLVYYQNYYNCKNPSGGEILILSPAIVRRVKDGWKLEEKGELAIGITDSQVTAPPKTQGFNSEPSVNRPALQFPVSAETYLNKIGDQGEMATRDWLSEGLLIQDPNRDQEFIIVKDAESAAGLYHAVPRFWRFATRNDYNTYYRDYYNCENPSGGTVWIISPTIVRRVKEGWTLMKKGKLEIR